jgi:hypothetical protein
MRDCDLNWLTRCDRRLEFQSKLTGDFGDRLTRGTGRVRNHLGVADRPLKFHIVLAGNDGSYDDRHRRTSNSIPDFQSNCEQNRETGGRRNDQSLSPTREHALGQDSTP